MPTERPAFHLAVHRADLSTYVLERVKDADSCTKTRQRCGCRPNTGVFNLCPLIEGQSTNIIGNGCAVNGKPLKPNASLS